MSSSSPVGNPFNLPFNLPFDPTGEFGLSGSRGNFTTVLRRCRDGRECGQSGPFEEPPTGQDGSPIPFEPAGWTENGCGGRGGPIRPQGSNPLGSGRGGASWPNFPPDHQGSPSALDQDGDDCRPSGGGHLSVKGNTISDGEYTITASTADGGTLTVTDNDNHKETFTVWGDPHIKTGAGGTANFQHAPVTFKLPDGTEITVTPTDNPGVNTTDEVTITSGNDAVTITGFKSGHLDVDHLPGDGYHLDATIPHGTLLWARNGDINDLIVGNGGPQIYHTDVGNIDPYASLSVGGPDGDTVYDGRYTIVASDADSGTLTVTDNVTKETFTVWGDPHIKTSAGGTANFQHVPVTFKLPDGTEITVTPTDNPGVNTIDHVTITKGNEAVTITGFKGGHLDTDLKPGDGYRLDATTQHGTMLYAKDGNIDDLVIRNAGVQIYKTDVGDIDRFAGISQLSDRSGQPPTYSLLGEINPTGRALLGLLLADNPGPGGSHTNRSHQKWWWPAFNSGSRSI